MKDNKITRKKYRLEVLERALNSIYDAIEDYDNSLKYNTEDLTEELDKPEEEQREWTIKDRRENIEQFTLKIEEAKKLITDLEKMV
ncbi:hypothetical protein [Clostridium sp. AF32-12BH]|uniref:hypothetical protein n=1 Tax=Clostridium sp. AF32-12BH TaxID=2292006 RepID=UPI000E543507|nr:hypothetical protein [Clostridium sp. AF32-12BH]RHP45279.1 hypothetical protein DWZ40_12760 [Clostridium sp. AF32-12BH]